MAVQMTTTVTASQDPSDAQLLVQVQQRCRHLNEALEAERAKTSKLRRYISHLNAKVLPPPVEFVQEQSELQHLISEQAKLIEQLHAENQNLQEIAKTRTSQNQQLLTANEKLKARIIELRRQVRKYAERQLARKPAPRPAAAQAVPTTIHSVPNTVQTRPEVVVETTRSWLPTSVGRLIQK